MEKAGIDVYKRNTRCELQHQNKIRQRNLPRFDQPCNGEDLNYGVGSKSRRQWKSMLLYSDSKQRFELLKEDMMQNHCPFKKQPVNVILWKRSNTWQKNSATVKSRHILAHSHVTLWAHCQTSVRRLNINNYKTPCTSLRKEVQYTICGIRPLMGGVPFIILRTILLDKKDHNSDHFGEMQLS